MPSNNANTVDLLANSLYTVLVSGGFSAILCAALVWFFRTWIGERMKGAIQNEYNEKLESHKAQLQAANNTELEKLKAQLQATNDTELERLKAQLHIAATERSIKLTNIFEKQAEAIAEMYANLVSILGAVADYTSIMTFESTPSLKDRRIAVADSLQTFFKHYSPRRFYLLPETQKLVDKFVAELRHKTIVFMFDVEQGNQKFKDKSEGDTWLNTVDFLNKDCVKMLEFLDADFKRLLGIHETLPSPLTQTKTP